MPRAGCEVVASPGAQRKHVYATCANVQSRGAWPCCESVASIVDCARTNVEDTVTGTAVSSSSQQDRNAAVRPASPSAEISPVRRCAASAAGRSPPAKKDITADWSMHGSFDALNAVLPSSFNLGA